MRILYKNKLYSFSDYLIIVKDLLNSQKRNKKNELSR